MIEKDHSHENRPCVSVIMNCLNCSKYLREAIDSVYAQTFNDWEIIFWDNGSTDNSAEIARSYDERLRYFKGEHTVPLGNARNLAIGQARGKYIAFLDCDDIWLPLKIELQISKFQEDPGLVLVYSNSNIVDGEGNKLRTSFDAEKPYTGMIFNELLSSYNFIPLLSVLIRRDVLDEVGMFNSNLTVAEEYDLFLRIAYKHRVDYIDQPLASYRVHANNWSHKRDIGIKEELSILDKWIDLDPSLKKSIGSKLRIKRTKRRVALLLFYGVKYFHLPKFMSRFY
jgi:glycosyltransferase involved in cell wall biosynthesis